MTLSTEERDLPDDNHPPSAATRILVARATIENMLARASRAVNADEKAGQITAMPVDTFRMSLLAITAALNGEVRAEQLAIDDDGATIIAEILHEGRNRMDITVTRTWVEQASQLYGTAAQAGRHVEGLSQARGEWSGVSSAQFHAVVAAASALGDFLYGASKADRDAR